MKKETPVTLQDVIDYATEHNIPFDIPIGLALCDSERGDICTGIIVDTPDEACEYDDKNDAYIRTETTGVHCNLKGYSLTEELRDLPLNERRVLMLTDGCHSECY